MNEEAREEFLRAGHGHDLTSYKRAAFTFFYLCVFVVAFILLRHPWDWALAGLQTTWIVIAMAIMCLPGHCGVCGTYSGFAVPRPGAPQRAWWDMRPLARRNIVFLCPHHALDYLRASRYDGEHS